MKSATPSTSDHTCHTLSLTPCARSVSVSIQDAESLFPVVAVMHMAGRQANGVAHRPIACAAVRSSVSVSASSRVSRSADSAERRAESPSRPSVITSCRSPKAAPMSPRTSSRSARHAQIGRPQPSRSAAALARACEVNQ